MSNKASEFAVVLLFRTLCISVRLVHYSNIIINLFETNGMLVLILARVCMTCSMRHRFRDPGLGCNISVT